MSNIITYETENYIFLLPKDNWERDKIALPGGLEGYFLAPYDLKAISKKDTNLIEEFALNDELLDAETHLLKENGWMIVEDWRIIIEEYYNWLVRILNIGENQKNSVLKIILEDKLDLTYNMYSESGFYWSKSITSGKAKCLFFYDNYTDYHCKMFNYFPMRVRCISSDIFRPRLKV